MDPCSKLVQDMNVHMIHRRVKEKMRWGVSCRAGSKTGDKTGVKTSCDRRRRSRSSSAQYCNLQTEPIRHLKQDNYKKKALLRRCFLVLTQNFLDMRFC